MCSEHLWFFWVLVSKPFLCRWSHTLFEPDSHYRSWNWWIKKSWASFATRIWLLHLVSWIRSTSSGPWIRSFDPNKEEPVSSIQLCAWQQCQELCDSYCTMCLLLIVLAEYSLQCLHAQPAAALCCPRSAWRTGHRHYFSLVLTFLKLLLI